MMVGPPFDANLSRGHRVTSAERLARRRLIFVRHWILAVIALALVVALTAAGDVFHWGHAQPQDPPSPAATGNDLR